MVHNLTDRELWFRQGEEYLRKVRKTPVHPLVAVARARRAAESGRHNAKQAA